MVRLQTKENWQTNFLKIPQIWLETLTFPNYVIFETKIINFHCTSVQFETNVQWISQSQEDRCKLDAVESRGNGRVMFLNICFQMKIRHAGTMKELDVFLHHKRASYCQFSQLVIADKKMPVKKVMLATPKIAFVFHKKRNSDCLLKVWIILFKPFATRFARVC